MADNARDPAALEREIDRTREELARTIDEIVDRVSPKRAAKRRVELFRANAEHFRETVGAKVGADGARSAPARLRELQRGQVGGEGAAGPASEGYLGSTTYAVRRGKLSLVVGAGVLLAVAGVVVWRMRQR